MKLLSNKVQIKFEQAKKGIFKIKNVNVQQFFSSKYFQWHRLKFKAVGIQSVQKNKFKLVQNKVLQTFASG